MKKNANTRIFGKQVVLVPYELEHVERYHKWMSNTTLQQLTASEVLTLEKEYEMQKSWRDDNDKCTFIIMDRECYCYEDRYNVNAMIGDVNLFLQVRDDGIEAAEVEIMIAEESARGRGLGKQALCLMILYGIEQLGICMMTAKIGEDNIISLKLFQQIGFQKVSHSSVFKEITLELLITEDVLKTIRAMAGSFSINNFNL